MTLPDIERVAVPPVPPLEAAASQPEVPASPDAADVDGDQRVLLTASVKFNRTR